MHKLLLLTFALAYLWLVQGKQIEDKSNLEQVATAQDAVLDTAAQGVAQGPLIDSGDDADHVDSAVGREDGAWGTPYSLYMKQYLRDMKEKRPNKPNIVIVWDKAEYDTDQYRVDSVWIENHRYFVYQWSGFGIFTLKQVGGWQNWAYSGYFKRSGKTLVAYK